MPQESLFYVAAKVEIGDRNLEGLHSAESAVFGSTSGASPLHAQIIQKTLKTDSFKSLPHKPPTDPRSVASANGFTPHETFAIVLKTSSGIPSVWNCAVGSLLLTIGIGGLGRRSRRGFGSLSLDFAP